MEQVLEEKYGPYSSGSYTSLRYDELGIEDITFDEFVSGVRDGTQGIYSLQWETGDNVVTLSLTIDPRYTYYEGSVSTSG